MTRMLENAVLPIVTSPVWSNPFSMRVKTTKDAGISHTEETNARTGLTLELNLIKRGALETIAAAETQIHQNMLRLGAILKSHKMVRPGNTVLIQFKEIFEK